MSMTMEVSAERHVARLRFEGRLDISLAPQVWRACASATSVYDVYVVDLTEVDEVFDSGLGLLILLCNRIHAVGGRVQLIAHQPEIRDRLNGVDSVLPIPVAATLGDSAYTRY